MMMKINKIIYVIILLFNTTLSVASNHQVGDVLILDIPGCGDRRVKIDSGPTYFAEQNLNGNPQYADSRVISTVSGCSPGYYGYLDYYKNNDAYNNNAGLYQDLERYVFQIISSDCLAEEETLKSECGETEGTDWEWTDKDNCEGECIVPCKAENEALTAKCGGEEGEAWKWTDKDNCEGECIYKDCTGPGEETLNEAKARCESDYSPGVLTYYDAPQCRGVCGCLKADYNAEKARCGKLGGIKYFSEVTCTADCGSCQDLYKKVKKECEAQYGVLKEFHCKDSNGKIEGTPTWLCDTNTKIPPAGSEPEPAPEPAPPDKTPEPDQPDNPSDPSDAKLGGIQKDLGKIIDQNNDRKNQLNKANNKLDWIGKNNKIIADNTKIIGDKLNDIDSGISDVNENIKGLSDDLGSIDKTLKDISKGSYTKPTEKDPYESEEHSFGDRTSDFLSQMKTTGLFSIANQLSTSIPGGGSPVFTIHTGDTFGGDHQIDFSNFSFALNMLKYLFQISGMVIAIRIVTLKR